MIHMKAQLKPVVAHPIPLAALKELAEPTRLRILFALGTECRPVSDIMLATDLPQTNVSFHLRVLREGGWVRAERRGAYVYYCLVDAALLGILEQLSHWMRTHCKGTEAAVGPVRRAPNRLVSNM